MSEPEKPNTKTECYGCEKLTERVEQLQDENKRLREALTRLVHNGGVMKLVVEHPVSLLAESYENARKLLNL